MNTMVVGLGKLGLPLAALIAKSGHKVLGYDKSSSLIDSLNSGSFYSSEPGLSDLLSEKSTNLTFHSSINFDVLKDIELIFIVVPTPSLPNGAFSNEFIQNTISEICPKLRSKTSQTVICIVSTVMPGSCDGEISENLKLASGEIQSRIGLCYHPEFIALGSVIKNLQFPDYQLLGVSDSWVLDVVEPIFKSIVKFTVPLKSMSLLEAEIVKIAVNNYITMKISFANSLLQLSDKFQNVNINNITEAVGLDSRIGSKYLTAGTPYGGPCFPRDTKAMAKLFNDSSVINSFPEITSNINQDFKNFLVKKILDQTSKSDIIGVLGVSYKVGTPVIDESPGVSIGLALLEKGMKIYSWDDEQAKIPHELILDLELDEILRLCDFFVITRGTPYKNLILDKLKSYNKKYLDLWGF
jgi:UDPglucose 6-dehydrogenase